MSFVGENAFALPGVAADPQRGVDAEPSGLSHLTRWLGQEYGLHEQDNVTMHLDKFFAFRRGARDLARCIAAFEMVYDEASETAGLEIHAIGRSHLLLSGCELPQRKIDDIKLKVDGDLNRYADQAKNRADDFGGFYGDDSWWDEDEWYEGDWGEYEASWGDEDWSSNDWNSSSWDNHGDQQGENSSDADACKGSAGGRGRGKGGKGKRKSKKGRGKGRRRHYDDEYDKDDDSDYWYYQGFVNTPRGTSSSFPKIDEGPGKTYAGFARTGASMRRGADLLAWHEDDDLTSSATTSWSTIADAIRIIGFVDRRYGRGITPAGNDGSSISAEAYHHIDQTTTLHHLYRLPAEELTLAPQVSMFGAIGSSDNRQASYLEDSIFMFDRCSRRERQKAHFAQLLRDPGAASGIVGTDSLLTCYNDALEPLGVGCDLVPTTAKFTGIDAVPAPGIGKSKVPLGMPMLENATSTGDLTGGPGSCPGLFSLKSSIKFEASMLANAVPFMDGILALFPDDEYGKHQRKPVRAPLLRADSGHCVTPIDNCDSPEEVNQTYLRKELMKYLEAFNAKYKITKHQHHYETRASFMDHKYYQDLIPKDMDKHD
ncbi:unnamed protein product [Prorocentrum cordatum]|uniref:Uncharacterized protein n=1 Tax=Prorocentrum cordatum TaxID=2364126 RepID=A0ABN9SFK0_9DINO|nr:unnamed protein product [Polarella glacialis]